MNKIKKLYRNILPALMIFAAFKMSGQAVPVTWSNATTSSQATLTGTATVGGQTVTVTATVTSNKSGSTKIEKNDILFGTSGAPTAYQTVLQGSQTLTNTQWIYSKHTSTNYPNIITFTVDKPVIISSFRVADVDYSQSSVSENYSISGYTFSSNTNGNWGNASTTVTNQGVSFSSGSTGGSETDGNGFVFHNGTTSLSAGSSFVLTFGGNGTYGNSQNGFALFLSAAGPVANNDSFSLAAGSTSTTSVLANDTNSAGAVPVIGTSAGQIQLTQISTTNSGVNLNTSTGLITVAAGTPAGTYTINYRICEQTALTNCSTATATVYVRPDSDGDGIADGDDLDSDNDGILDRDEGFTPVFLNFSSITRTNPNITTFVPQYVNGPGSYSVGMMASYNTSLPSGELPTAAPLPPVGYSTGELVLGTFPTNTNMNESSYMQYTITFSYPVKVRFSPNSGVNVANFDGPDSWRITASNGDVVATNLGSYNGSASISVNNAGPNDIVVTPTTPSKTTATGWAMETTEKVSSITWKMWSNNTATSGQTNSSPIRISVEIPSDTDADGIPNYLDTDSDGDGCPDAVEGGDNITQSMLNAAGNINVAANGTTTPVVVDANGVPVVVNTGSVYNVDGQAQGQTVGTAYTSNPAAVGGTASANQTIVSGQTPAALTLTGYTGTIQWQSSTDNVTFTNISGATSSTYAPGPLTSTTYYRAVLTNEGGCTAISTVVTVTIALPVPFTCDTNMYIVQGAASELFRIDTSANPFNFIKISGTPYTASVNATAYNVKDNYIYGVTGGANVTKKLILIDRNGAFYDMGEISGLDISASYTSGEMDENGNYYIKLAGQNTKLYKVDLATRTATLINLSRNINFIDIAYTLTDKLLWTQDTVSKKLVSINPTTGVVTDLPFVNTLNDYGAWFGSSTGQIYASSNSGAAFVEFNKATGEAMFISNTQSSNNNDGAHCPNAAISFDLYCRKLPVTNAGTTYPSKHGITALSRAGSDNSNWPMVRQSAWTVLEANAKGFVVNRVAFNNTSGNPIGIDAANFVEGMMVFDTTNQCLKIYNGTIWSCYSTPACPQ